MTSRGRRGSETPEIAPERLRAATNEIAALIQDRLPLHQPSGDVWPAIAHAFLARGGTLLESITLQVERGMPGEAQMLLRVLIEHVTKLCWLGIDPERKVAEWQKWADHSRYQVHKYANQQFGIETMEPAEAAEAENAKRPTELRKLASEVDAHWSEVSPAFRSFDPANPDFRTFIGVYRAVYSKTSNLVHAHPASIERFMTMPLQGEVTIHAREKRNESNDYPSFALAMMGFLLVVFEQHFDWPKRDVIDRVTNGLVPD